MPVVGTVHMANESYKSSFVSWEYSVLNVFVRYGPIYETYIILIELLFLCVESQCPQCSFTCIFHPLYLLANFHLWKFLHDKSIPQ